MTIYHLILMAAWFVFIVYWLFSAFSTKKNAQSALSWRGVAWRIAAILILIVILRSSSSLAGFAAFQVTPAAYPALGIIGDALAVFGIGFAVWARVHLGRNWGMPMTVKEGPELITTGPYAHLRHPIYSGVLLAILGSAFVAGPFWLAVFLASFAYFAYSARAEERTMLNAFPDIYPAYRARTNALIPFVW